MLHWVIACRFGPPETPAPDFFPAEFLSQVTSLAANPRGIAISPGQAGERAGTNYYHARSDSSGTVR